MVDNVVIAMPAYNAGATIESVFARIPRNITKRIKYHIVVNDGSRDDTAKALIRLSGDVSNLILLNHKHNEGYGASEKDLLRTALEKDAEMVVLLHSDGQYAPEKIPDLLQPFDAGEADLVQGSRMLEGGAREGGMPIYKRVANRWLTAIENRGFGMSMAEYHSGYMVYSRRLLEAVPLDTLSDSFDFDLEMIVCAHILGMRIKEVAIPTRYSSEVSYLNPIKYGLDVLRVVRRYRRGYYHKLLGKGECHDSC